MSSEASEQRWFIGVDIGGTKVAGGLVGESGEIQQTVRVPMNADSGPEAGLHAVNSAIAGIVSQLPQNKSFSGIGICAPGPLDPSTGIILNPPNLPCWRNFPLAERISQLYTVPVKVDNDANAAALAEAQWGSGRDYRNVFFASIGTGIGTGIIFDRRIYHGRTGSAAEGGHVSIDYRGPICNCGKPGCIEILASGTAIVRRARAKAAEPNNRDSTLMQLADGKVENISGELIGRAYAEHCALAEQTLQETADLIALWLGNTIDFLEPDVMIIGGGAAVLLQPFMDSIRRRIPSVSVNPRSSEIPLVPATYGADAGIAGGAALCL